MESKKITNILLLAIVILLALGVWKIIQSQKLAKETMNSNYIAGTHPEVEGTTGNVALEPVPIKMNFILPAHASMQSGTNPPTVVYSSDPYSCLSNKNYNSNNIAPGSGKNVEKIINGKKFCVSTISEAGMSQLYTEYVYATAFGAGTKKTSFTIHTTNGCGVYDEPEASVCTKELNTLNQNLDLMVASLF